MKHCKMAVRRISNMKREKWPTMHHDAIQNEIDYSNVFNPPVFNFFDNMTKSVGSSIGFLAPSAIAAIAFMLSLTGCTVKLNNYNTQPLNLMWFVVGPPSTAKSWNFRTFFWSGKNKEQHYQQHNFRWAVKKVGY